MRDQLATAVVEACKALFDVVPVVQLTRPEEQFGDYATNVALQLSKQVGKNPREIADALASRLKDDLPDTVKDVTVAGPGFINISLSDQTLWTAAQAQPSKLFANKKVLLEYSCPNAFKELHVGHLYNTIIGDTISGFVEKAGGTVFRANFGSDVGLPVARCLWGIKQLIGEDPTKLADVPVNERAQWLSRAYVEGAKADADGSEAATDIKALNKAVYAIHAQDDHDSPLAQIYWECRDWSYDYFKAFYDDLKAAPFDKFYPESSVTNRGLEAVQQNIGPVFSESQGAIVFKGEEHGVHTRVFITSAGLPTYETKDLGVVLTECDDFTYDRRIVFTGNEQSEYMKVVFAALTELDKELADKQTHISNGTVLFGDGKKMSSRLGNVSRAVEVLEAVEKTVESDNDQLRNDISLGAIRYTFLRQRLGGDIAFDVDESVSLQGNSGPYLQYAHARACSILAKSKVPEQTLEEPEFTTGEHSLVRKLSEYVEAVDYATQELAPHHICTYLYELAQVFNRFYEHNRVLDDPRQTIRLELVRRYAHTLKAGLELLNIPAPERL